MNAAMEEMKKKLSDLEKKVVTLEDKVVLLEAHKAISEIVTKKLSDEVNKLSQYTRRSNIIVSNVLKPEDKSDEEVVQNMHTLIKTELKLPEVIGEIDKLHRTGKVKTVNGKILQDIVIRFKSHTTRYKVYNERKMARNVKIRPDLTKGNKVMLYEAQQITGSLENVNFVYANAHGNISLRLHRPHNNRYVFPFSTIEDLNKLLEFK